MCEAARGTGATIVRVVWRHRQAHNENETECLFAKFWQVALLPRAILRGRRQRVIKYFDERLHDIKEGSEASGLLLNSSLLLPVLLQSDYEDLIRFKK